MPTTTYPYDFVELTTSEIRNEEHYNFKANTFDAKRFFIGAWANRHNFVNEYLLVPANPVNFARPQRYPDGPIAHVVDVKLTGVGQSTVNTISDMASYDKVIIEVTYETTNFNIPGQNEQYQDEGSLLNNIYLEESGDVQGEGLVIDGEDLLIEGVAIVDKTFNTLIITGSITLTHHFIINPYWIIYDHYIGCVNNLPFITPGGRVFASEKLRYDGPGPMNTKVNVNTLSGENFPYPVWSITHNFSYNKHGWNNKFIDGIWQAVRKEDGKRLFPAIELYDIFTGANPLTILTEATRNLIDHELGVISLLVEVNVSINDPIVLVRIDAVRLMIQSLGFRIP